MHVLALERRCSTSTHASTRHARMHVCVLYCAWHARTLPHALALPHVMHALALPDYMREAWLISHSNCSNCVKSLMCRTYLRSLFCFQHANLVERNHRVRRSTCPTTHTSDISHHTCVGTYTDLAYICRVRTCTHLAYVCRIDMLP
jgi:hypothetical protein